VTDQLNKILTEDFSNTMKKLEIHGSLFITFNGSYFEKINRKKLASLLNFYSPSTGNFGPNCLENDSAYSGLIIIINTT